MPTIAVFSAARYLDYFAKPNEAPAKPTIEDVLHFLVHDGYLERHEEGYRFVSGLLEDWWRARYGTHFSAVIDEDTTRRQG